MSVWRVRDLACSGFGRESTEASLADEDALRSELVRLASLEPRVVCIELSDVEYLQIGLGGPWAFVEHVVDEPWKAEIALSRSPEAEQKPGSVCFVCGDQESEIPAQYLMSSSEAFQVEAVCLRLCGAAPGWRCEPV